MKEKRGKEERGKEERERKRERRRREEKGDRKEKIRSKRGGAISHQISIQKRRVIVSKRRPAAQMRV